MEMLLTPLLLNNMEKDEELIKLTIRAKKALLNRILEKPEDVVYFHHEQSIGEIDLMEETEPYKTYNFAVEFKEY